MKKRNATLSMVLLIIFAGIVGLLILGSALVIRLSPATPTFTPIPALPTVLATYEGPTPLSTTVPVTAATAFYCDSSKIAFYQNNGCVNDGAFEFCIPNDPQSVEAALRIAPRADCRATAGRAGCNLETELLCIVPTWTYCNPSMPDALGNEGWTMVCQLATLPFVREIIPTWYE